MRCFEMTTKTESQIYNLAYQELLSFGLKARLPKSARISKQRHIRIENSINDIENVAKNNGLEMNYDNVPNLSGKFTQFSIKFPENYHNEDLAAQTIYALSNLKGETKVAQKQLIPARFGLSGKSYKKLDLARTLRQSISTIINDDLLKEFLLQLVDTAVKKRSRVDPEIMQELDPDTVRITGIDFGEILTPLVLSDESDNISFPVGNSMLADVEINNQPFSVKSASGSGTSFKAIQTYMDQFQDGLQKGNITLDNDEQEIHNFFRTFIDTKGTNIDKIIAASESANTDEHQLLEKVLGKKNFSYQDLIEFSEKFKSYSDFLKKIYPISVAGKYKRPNGLPADYQYYMGLSDKKPKPKQAGKPSWDADQGKAGANILTYVLGTSFLADAKKEIKIKKYNNLLKRILGNVNAKLAKIDITQDGKIQIKQTPFTELNYEFQYHAPSHIPGNNLPGFSLILD